MQSNQPRLKDLSSENQKLKEKVKKMEERIEELEKQTEHWFNEGRKLAVELDEIKNNEP